MTDAQPRHRLLAILAADAAGYSRLMAADERATLHTLDAARAVFAEEATARAGRIVDTAGDSILAVFETASGAVGAALAVQDRLDGVAPASAPERRMRFRIGVHLGDVIEKADGSVYGNGVNVAARLQSLAEPGGLCISDAVRGTLAAPIGHRFADQGLQAVKNIAEPVHTYRLADVAAAELRRTGGAPRRRWLAVGAAGAVVALAAALLVLRTPTPTPTPPAVAPGLLPLSLMLGAVAAPPGDAPAAAAAERLRGDLTSGFSAPQFRNRYSVLAARVAAESEATEPPLEQARRAGVRFLLEGRVRRDGDAVVAQLQLVDVPAGAQKWSSSVALKDGGAAALTATIGEIGNEVFGNEALRVLAAPVDRLTPTELMVRGSALYNAKPTLQGIDEALRLCDLALAKDPNSLPALGLKAFMLLNRYDEERSPDHEAYARDLDALTAHMLSLDRRDPYAWSLRGMALLFTGRWASASEAVDQLVAVAGPSFAVVDKANVELFLGRPGDALATLQGTGKADQNWQNYLACHAHLLLGDARAAIGECERAIGNDPHLWSAHLYLAAARAQTGELDAARKSLAEVERMSPGHTVVRLRSYRYAAHPEYQRLAAAHYYPGLAKAGMPER